MRFERLLSIKVSRCFALNLAKKTGAKAKSIDTEDIEDSRLADLIEKGMKTKTVSRESVMEILGQK